MYIIQPVSTRNATAVVAGNAVSAVLAIVARLAAVASFTYDRALGSYSSWLRCSYRAGVLTVVAGCAVFAVSAIDAAFVAV